jgi:CRISPR-associated endonuclease/helicase Cas3
MSSLSAPAKRYWAKAEDGDWHPLVAHCTDVAAVLECLVAPGTVIGARLAAACGVPALPAADRARLCFLAAIHDAGKTSHGFQTKTRPKGERGNWKHRGHVKVLLDSIGLPVLRPLFEEAVMPRIGGDRRTGPILLATAIAHHGRPWIVERRDGLSSLWCPDGSGRDPVAEIRRLVEHAARWSGIDSFSGTQFSPVAPAFTHLFAGALTLADWVGSTRTAFPFEPWADDDPDRYLAVARERAASACARIGLAPRPVAVSLTGLPLLETIFPETFVEARSTPTALQSLAAEMPLPEPGARLLIESETGSGKTEAALALYVRLRAEGRVGGLMFALPTRATATAMYDRVRSALRRMFPDGGEPTAALAVGGRQPLASSTEPLVAEAPQTWDDGELERWASSSAKKFLAAEVVVGTLDQVLLGGLPVRHAHLRLAALSRHLLVVDELHAYDRYMAAVLGNLLELHSAAGGTALFMSATLASVARAAFGGVDAPEREAAERTPYPTLAVCERPGAGWRDHPVTSESVPRRIRWEPATRPLALERAVEAARAGARVCVLRNTVRGARTAVDELAALGHGDLLWRPVDSPLTPPYHARYTAPDRRVLDEAVLARFGKGAAARTGGVILVSTQVVEQSLDVDFDLLVTDLCPVDVLLQRIGRLHRHRARDPHRPAEHRHPLALVIAPEGGFGGRLTSRSLDLGWGRDRPYPNYADGELTLRLVRDLPEIEIPRDNRMLVESVYHGDAREPLRLDEAWDSYLNNAEGVELSAGWLGRDAALRFGDTYVGCHEQFRNADEAKVRTRLGDDSFRIPLDRPVRGWYTDEEVHHVDIPAFALAGVPEEELRVGSWFEPTGGGTGFHVGPLRVSYDADGWSWSRQAASDNVKGSSGGA